MRLTYPVIRTVPIAIVYVVMRLSLRNSVWKKLGKMKVESVREAKLEEIVKKYEVGWGPGG